ncbi:hypothetical protein FisN_20Lh204 [Fistulifera solaris]|uniref:HSF-type DNA-binding domain-containing protein n=1 Tax=Fistulifera solaris TaxID=1519565 RepID=A0A1Z5KRT2_FISSO|nr:hypothetical protein FisN_20Lh204 [Fistulifera solaris]|eukprot:GAX28897.1 hypothetical protein FisN_20Lh204 [Fistulifera solaris]
MIFSSSPALIGNERNSYYPLGSPLQSPLTAQEKSSKDAKLAMQEIAKEALRLTKQTIAQDCAKLDKDLCLPPPSKAPIHQSTSSGSASRLNKFVRRLHDMLLAEKGSGIVEWRRGLLVLHSTDLFAKNILPQYFNTRNFKTFRRQLNYYGFVHVRSFSTTGTATTALWVNRDLAQIASDEISSVLLLRRVEPCESAKTSEGRRERKELAIHTVEEDLGVSAKTLQKEQIRTLVERGCADESFDSITMHPVLRFPDLKNISCPRRVSSTSSSSLPVSNDENDKGMACIDSSSDEEGAATLLLKLSKVGRY